MRAEEISIWDTLPPDDELRIKFSKVKTTDWRWRMEKDYPPANGLKVFSCFAGGGGSTMGYKLAGCKVIGCCEIDKAMNAVYVKNHSPKYNFCMDLRNFNKIPSAELPEELFSLDILDGSPPCTTFSMAGQREKTWGQKKKFREGQAEQTLDDLAFVFIETARKLKPKCVIMENVEGLLAGNAIKYCKKIQEDFRRAGYNVKHWVLKGEHMGVPQRRHRVFFIALRKDIVFDLDQIDMHFNCEEITYGEIKDGNCIRMQPGSTCLSALQKAKRGEHDLADVYRRLGEKIRSFNDMIIWDNELCCTITSRSILMSGDNRAKLSRLDIVHAQTFPEDYDFCGRSVQYICGMSVPPVMIKRIVERLIKSGLFDEKKGALK